MTGRRATEDGDRGESECELEDTSMIGSVGSSSLSAGLGGRAGMIVRNKGGNHALEWRETKARNFELLARHESALYTDCFEDVKSRSSCGHDGARDLRMPMRLLDLLHVVHE